MSVRVIILKQFLNNKIYIFILKIRKVQRNLKKRQKSLVIPLCRDNYSVLFRFVLFWVQFISIVLLHFIYLFTAQIRIITAQISILGLNLKNANLITLVSVH